MKPFCLFVLLLAPFFLNDIKAQTIVTVEATLDSTEMYIGDQTRLSICVRHPSSDSVIYDKVKEKYLTKGIEIIKKGIQSVSDHDETVTTCNLILTSFDASLYYIPPMTVLVGGKRYQTKQLALKVKDVDIDTTQMAKFYGPKDVITPCYTWAEWRAPWGHSCLSVFILVLGVCLIVKLRKSTRSLSIIKKAALLPHEWAVQQIEQLKKFYSGTEYMVKDYYTNLIDIFRGYLQRRFKINALEMTSEEIMKNLLQIKDEESIRDIRKILETADVIKYARGATTITEDQINLMKIYSFVESSKTEMLDSGKEFSIEKQKSMKNKRSPIYKLTIFFVVIIFIINLIISISEVLSLL